jgi:hypothetical protein
MALCPRAATAVHHVDDGFAAVELTGRPQQDRDLLGAVQVHRTRLRELEAAALADRGVARDVAVVDGDCDGRFHSILSLPLDRAWRIPESDVFAIDLNRNGKFEISLYERSEVMPLGHLVQIADAYYALDIAADGMSLALSKTEPQFGTLVIGPNDTTVELKLWSDAADQYLRGRQGQLPAGKYKGTYAAFEKKDASGDVWSFSCELYSPPDRLGPLDFFVIEPGETTRLRVGPPFVVTAEVQAGGEVSISPVIVGCGGEHYQASFQRNGRRAPEHTVRIVDEKGTVLVADKFQYG